MINPQNLSHNCCLIKLQSSFKNAQKNSASNNILKTTFSKKQKKSLKPYCSMKHLMFSEMTKVSMEKPQSPQKSIIQKLEQSPYNYKNQLRTMRQQNPCLKNYYIYTQQSINQYEVKKPQPTLQRVKSLTKISFSYNSMQNNENYRIQTPQKQILKQNQAYVISVKASNKQSAVSEEKSVITFMKKQIEDDLRSTMQPFLEVPQIMPRRPKSIISIQDEQEMDDFMKESLIIEKHSETKILQKLIRI